MRSLFLPMVFLPLPLAAQHVTRCDGWIPSAENIAEPWEENSRSFAGGEVRVALLDTIEPGAVPLHLLVLSPPYDELGARQCRTVSWAEGTGYAGLDFAGMTADYDPARGLVLTMDGRLYLEDMEFSNILRLTVAINQATGDVTATHEIIGDH